ncbi:NAD(P)/FAD-dependent oxidoreductase [Streptomyces sp. ODS28]|uniref:flavin-containing monooxygenase n=1 Tax=Streptomyces sp. ODS28 TaxID=3136688 RepID=UPI0031E75207
MPISDEGTPVHVIGAGPGGLAVAAALRRRGVSAVVLERSDAVGASWRNRYDALRLHTTRRRSALPGLAVPRGYGRWVGRDDMVRYLESYADDHHLELAAGVEVHRIERRGEEWVLHANGGRRLTTPAVVVATGLHRTPYLPDWPGRGGFRGDLLHSAHYRDPAPYRGKDVLVVGAGNSGTEIAVDLARGGAARVRLAVRTPPHLVRRSWLGWPAQSGGTLCRRLPRWAVDAGARRIAAPDLTAHGLPRPKGGLGTRLREGAVPVVDSGDFVRAVRAGEVEPVAGVEAFEGEDKIRLLDESVIAPECVVAATGYRRDLDGLVGDLGVLDALGAPRVRRRGRAAEGAPGLYFTGFTSPPSGTLREIGREAERVAKSIARASAK